MAETSGPGATDPLGVRSRVSWGALAARSITL
jgi:hypothetical protein